MATNHPDTSRRVGRAVHDSLADIDLTTGCDAGGRSAAEVARGRARGHGLHEHADVVVAMVARALTSPTVADAGRRRFWRELSVVTPVADGGVLEGFVDLVVEDDDGLVVVDYKTDRLGVDGSAALTGHRLQVAAYAVALEASTGRRVQRCVLVFVGGNEPYEHILEGPDLAAAMTEVQLIADSLVSV
jgi:ATP-dependent helicase/nuclease subunit A